MHVFTVYKQMIGINFFDVQIKYINIINLGIWN